MSKPFHASCIALRRDDGSGPWVGALIMGPSGSGKSDLALRMLYDRPATTRLVADDYVDLKVVQGRLDASPPHPIEGKIEVRGLGIVTLPFLKSVSVKAVFDLKEPSEIVRLPQGEFYPIKGGNGVVELPLFPLAPFEASAPAKLYMALSQMDAWGIENDNSSIKV